MKAIVNKKNWTIELDNEAIKAIRFCLGYPTDLRIKLENADRNHIDSWIEENKLGLFGLENTEILLTSYDSDDWNKYERMIKNVVNQIIG